MRARHLFLGLFSLMRSKRAAKMSSTCAFASEGCTVLPARVGMLKKEVEGFWKGRRVRKEMKDELLRRGHATDL